MSCSRCGYSACYSVHSCPRCNPATPDHERNIRNAKALQASIDSAFLSIAKALLALFLHPWFCFVGFWIVGVLSLMLLAPLLGVIPSWNVPWEAVPPWYRYVAFGLPVVAAVALRKFVPSVMKWLLIVGVSALALWGAIALGMHLIAS